MQTKPKKRQKISNLMPVPETDLDVLAEEANEAHGSAISCLGQALRHAKASGDALWAAKEYIKHGQWGTCLKSNFDASAETANVYMRISKYWESKIWPVLETDQNLTIEEAREILRRSKKGRTGSPSTKPQADLARDAIRVSLNKWAGDMYDDEIISFYNILSDVLPNVENKIMDEMERQRRKVGQIWEGAFKTVVRYDFADLPNTRPRNPVQNEEDMERPSVDGTGIPMAELTEDEREEVIFRSKRSRSMVLENFESYVNPLDNFEMKVLDEMFDSVLQVIDTQLRECVCRTYNGPYYKDRGDYRVTINSPRPAFPPSPQIGEGVYFIVPELKKEWLRATSDERLQFETWANDPIRSQATEAPGDSTALQKLQHAWFWATPDERLRFEIWKKAQAGDVQEA